MAINWVEAMKIHDVEVPEVTAPVVSYEKRDKKRFQQRLEAGYIIRRIAVCPEYLELRAGQEEDQVERQRKLYVASRIRLNLESAINELSGDHLIVLAEQTGPEALTQEELDIYQPDPDDRFVALMVQ